MRIHLIACRVLAREIHALAAQSPHMLDITWLPQGLHDTPGQLRDTLQRTIGQIFEEADSGLMKHFPDAIALGYGLCSNGVVGLVADRAPLVVPRTDDCIALFLGSQKQYQTLFDAHPGTFWLNNGWMEACYGYSADWKTRRQQSYDYYVETYGEDNADFLIEQDELWIRNYKQLAFIDSDIFRSGVYTEDAKRLAEGHGWAFRRETGDARLLRLLVNGEWNGEEFCVCPPRHRIEAAYDGSKMRAVPIE